MEARKANESETGRDRACEREKKERHDRKVRGKRGESTLELICAESRSPETVVRLPATGHGLL